MVMPIYEYRCQLCGHQLELLQKVDETPATDCPACGKPSLQKLISAAGFQLKGSGWYVTDFKNKDKKPVEKVRNEGNNNKDNAEKPAAKSEDKSTSD